MLPLMSAHVCLLNLAARSPAGLARLGRLRAARPLGKRRELRCEGFKRESLAGRSKGRGFESLATHLLLERVQHILLESCVVLQCHKANQVVERVGRTVMGAQSR